jgi:hypothetical protein
MRPGERIKARGITTNILVDPQNLRDAAIIGARAELGLEAPPSCPNVCY